MAFNLPVMLHFVRDLRNTLNVCAPWPSTQFVPLAKLLTPSRFEIELSPNSARFWFSGRIPRRVNVCVEMLGFVTIWCVCVYIYIYILSDGSPLALTFARESQAPDLAGTLWLPTGARCPVFSTTALQDLGLQLKCPPPSYQFPVPLPGELRVLGLGRCCALDSCDQAS